MNPQLLRALQFVFEADKGSGSGTSSTPPEGGQKSEDQSGESADAKTGEETGKKPEDKAEEKKFTQAELEKHIAERLSRERAKAEREAKEKQGEFQKLYDELKPTHEQTLAKLETAQKENERITSIMQKQIEDEISKWPDEVKALDPGKDSSLESRLNWLEKARPLASKMTGNVSTGRRSVNAENSGGQKDHSGAVGVQSYLDRTYGGAKVDK